MKRASLSGFSGSSLATAFAAGLAGLILFSLTVYIEYAEEEKQEHARERLMQAKTADGMRKIFNILSGNSQRMLTSDVIIHLEDKFQLDVKEQEKEEILREFIESISQK